MYHYQLTLISKFTAIPLATSDMIYEFFVHLIYQLNKEIADPITLTAFTFAKHDITFQFQIAQELSQRARDEFTKLLVERLSLSRAIKFPQYDNDKSLYTTFSCEFFNEKTFSLSR